jgi:conjugal transfer pilus assembly protein TraI
MVTQFHTPIAVGDLIKAHDKRVDLVRQCANEAQPAEFHRKWMAVLERCASWFSSVPLRPDQHAEPGGAFRGTIEVAYYAMRLAGGQKFAADLTSEQRRRLEPQYIHALFLAAVCSWLDESYRHFRFERASDNLEWNPAAHGAIGDWLGDSKYRVFRRESALPVERMRTAVLAQLVVGPALLSGLDGVVLSDLFGAINPVPIPQGVESLIHKVVRQAIVVAEDFERKAVRAAFAPVQFDAPSAVDVALAVPSVTAQPELKQPVEKTSALAAPTLPQTDGPSRTQASDVSSATPIAADARQSQLPFSPVEGADAAPGPNAAAASPPVRMTAEEITAGSRPARAAADSGDFEKVLTGAPNMLKEFMRALAQDVAAGSASVQWSGADLVLPKKSLGNYGIASDTLVNLLRQRGLLARAQGSEIALVEVAGQLISPRP